MKDPIDTVTAELPLPRRRGRPATGCAKSAAERKRDQRRRDLRVSMADRSITAMCADLSRWATEGDLVMLDHVFSQLRARAQAVFDARAVQAEQTAPPDEQLAPADYVQVMQSAAPVTVTQNDGDDLDDWEDPAPAPVKRVRPSPKYRSPHGQTWTGRGLQPKWVQQYIADGGRLDDLLL